MNITELSSSQLKAAIKLIEQKDALLERIKKIDAQLESLQGGKKSPAKRAPKAAKKPAVKAKRKRVTVATKVIEVLKKAGSEGMSVKVLSEKLKMKNQSVHAWYNNTGKKVKEIEKLPSGALKFVG